MTDHGDQAAADQAAADQEAAEKDAKDRAEGKFKPAETPGHDDPGGLCGWLTEAFGLDWNHKITGGLWYGLRGPDGHVVLQRHKAPAIHFEPATRINTPMRLVETLAWQLLPTDGRVPAFKTGHCAQIAHVIRMLCDSSQAITADEETLGIIGTFLQSAQRAADGSTTYGTGEQSYAAIIALRRKVDEVTGHSTGPQRYIVDAGTRELVIGARDLQEAGRAAVGSSLRRGFLDARMEAVGWQRITLDGHERPGRAGRDGPHARMSAYRGRLPGDDDPEAAHA